MKRRIDLDDQFDLTLKEKLFINAKRLCIVTAVAALALSGVDLLNAHALGSATDSARHIQMSSLTHTVEKLSFTSASPSVTVTIPNDVVVAVIPPVAELCRCAPTGCRQTGYAVAADDAGDPFFEVAAATG